MDENEEKKVVCDILESVRMSLRYARFTNVVLLMLIIFILLNSPHIGVLVMVLVALNVLFAVTDTIGITRQMKKVSERYKQFAPQVKPDTM